jgi:hypothetical protein
MRCISEDEDDVDFEEYLLPDDYKLYLERQKSTTSKNVMLFPPKYLFRPTAEEVGLQAFEFISLFLDHGETQGILQCRDS